jgi:hypothetical protein
MGDFYGTTTNAGAHRYGTVLNLSVGLEPFVRVLPGSCKIGAAVRAGG